MIAFHPYRDRACGARLGNPTVRDWSRDRSLGLSGSEALGVKRKCRFIGRKDSRLESGRKFCFTAVMPNHHVRKAVTDDDVRIVARLFAEYATSLPINLDYQDFAGEIARLPGKYSAPGGALFLALDASGLALGCVGLRPMGAPGWCEMKRLYLLPSARGFGLGRALTSALIDEATRLGYQRLMLDTLPTMMTATALYQQVGFKRIEPYYAPTPIGTLFMALTL